MTTRDVRAAEIGAAALEHMFDRRDIKHILRGIMEEDSTVWIDIVTATGLAAMAAMKKDRPAPPSRTCRDCKHSRDMVMGRLTCTWEDQFLPPPVRRARLWGAPSAETWDNAATECPHYVKKGT